MASSPMFPLLRFGRKQHPIDRKRYGQPRVALYYANRQRFTAPGLYVWVFGQNRRILPTGRRRG